MSTHLTLVVDAITPMSTINPMCPPQFSSWLPKRRH